MDEDVWWFAVYDLTTVTKLSEECRFSFRAYCSLATNPESVVAPWEFPRSSVRHLGNYKVGIGALRSLSDTGKISLGILSTLGNC